MLRTGIAVDEVHVRVQELVGVEDDTKIADGMPSRSVSANLMPDYLDDVTGRSMIAGVDRDRFAEARRLNCQHWIGLCRPISAETLRQRLHVSAAASRELTRAVRVADRAAVVAAGSG